MDNITSNIIETTLSVPIATKVEKYYPIGYYNNNRYRGPIESFKEININNFIVENIKDLCNVYNNLTKRFSSDISPIESVTVENDLQTYKRLEEL